MVSSNAGSASALTFHAASVPSMLWGLRLRSDIRKLLTCTGLAPSPARWDVRMALTVSVTAFVFEIHTDFIIIKNPLISQGVPYTLFQFIAALG